MDNFSNQLAERFSADNCSVSALMKLVPDVLLGLDDEELKHLTKELMFWQSDLPSPEAVQVSFVVQLCAKIFSYLPK